MNNFIGGYGRMYILINIVLAETIWLFPNMSSFFYFKILMTDCEVNTCD